MRSSQPSAAHATRKCRLAAALVAAGAFLLYGATLLPGVELGDSGSFQTIAGSAFPTPRNGYPLYFALGGLFLRVVGGDAAHALNLFSAVAGAVACGLFVIVGVDLSGSVGAGVAGAMLFAVSYTFWSQAVIAEVYALHIALILGSTALLFRWQAEPTTARLGMFFACFALSFGNHLSTILLFPPFALFLLLAAPGGWRSMVTPRTIALALAIGFAGSLQYLWNLRTLWFLPDPPATVGEALRTFWFDVTKVDWRESMMFHVPDSMLVDRRAMYWFDLRQQFGLTAILLGIAGASVILVTNWRRAVLILLAYALNFIFAFNYNVGDAHVFYLPSHLFVALLVTIAVAAIGRLVATGRGSAAVVASVVLSCYAAARGIADYPAQDRSRDGRAPRMLAALTNGLDDRHAVLLADPNWQIANGLSYYAKGIRPDVAVAWMRNVLPRADAIVRDNLEIGRAVALDSRALALLGRESRHHWIVESDSVQEIAHALNGIVRGTPYVLTVLKPTRDFSLNRADLDAGLRVLCGGPVSLPPGDYAVVSGQAGLPPVIVAAANLPFHRSVHIAGTRVEIRMESWLAADTIRRMGFGHVIAGRQHTLIVERGVSFATFAGDGTPRQTYYFAGLFEQPQRHFIRR